MAQRKKILIVDDSELNRALLADILAPSYDTMEASSGLEAVSIMERQYTDIALVLLDIVMPEMDGFEVLSVMNRNNWIDSVPVIMISSEAVSTFADRAYDLGASDYIARPFDERIVLHRIRNTIMLYAKQQYLENLVTEQIMEKERINAQMVEILSNIVEFRNGESGLHVLHIRIITNLLLQALQRRCPQYGLTMSRISVIANASALHDIGKISIDERILNKPGRLTKEEFEVMKTHSAIGAQILEETPLYKESEFMHISRDICRWHHERYDGRGYPDGLKGDEIPIAAQVVSMADVYDALTSERVYKPAFPHEKAIQMIRNGECGAFSPLLLECLDEIADKLRAEMSSASSQSANSLELQRVASEVISQGELHISGRTLTLLEQERAKFDFYASMSKEILFEYNCGTDLLEFSSWGARYLGVPELVPHPSQSLVIQSWGSEAYTDMKSLLVKTTSAEPIVSRNYCLSLNGKPHWFKAVARTLWDNEDQPSFSRIIGKLIDIHEDQVQLTKLRELAMRDSLTSLYNQAAAREIVQNDLERRDGGSCLMMLLDLDSFRDVNEKFGTLAGDNVLKQVAENIQRSIRKGDVAARVGSDEFLVFMQFRGDPQPLTQRIFDATSFWMEGFDISSSMGVALCPQDGADYGTLFRCADRAMNAAKQAGGRQVLFYEDGLPEFSSLVSSDTIS